MPVEFSNLITNTSIETLLQVSKKRELCKDKWYLIYTKLTSKLKFFAFSLIDSFKTT